MNVKRISASEFLEAGLAASITIDLRTSAEYEKEHIEGCIVLPIQELTVERFNRVLGHVNGRSVHLLCQSGRRADMAVEKLQGKTDKELVIIEGGLNALKPLGVDIKLGSRKTISIARQVRIAAGALTVAGVALGLLIHPIFLGVSVFVGAGLMFAGITDTCGMGMVLARAPWNSASKPK